MALRFRPGLSASMARARRSPAAKFVTGIALPVVGGASVGF
jgi:hypothetical protein